MMNIRIQPDVRSIVDADGAVLLDIRRGKYFSLNSTGIQIWQKLEQGWNLSDIEADLSTVVDAATARRDLTAFIDGLKKARLVHDEQ